MVLALDASISSTGFAVVDYDNTLLDCGKITTKKNKKVDNDIDDDNRIVIIANAISELFKKYNMKEVSMENQFVRNNIKTAMQLSRLRGALMMICKLNGATLYYPTPSQIRSDLMNNGSATKEEVAEYVRLFYINNSMVQALGEFNDRQCKDKNSDIYDAISIGLAYNKTVKKD